MTTMVTSKTMTNIIFTLGPDIHCTKFSGYLVKYPGQAYTLKSDQKMTFDGHKSDHKGHIGSR